VGSPREPAFIAREWGGAGAPPCGPFQTRPQTPVVADPANGIPGLIVPRARRIGYVGLASVLFFTVSGGPYGLEALVSAVNPGWAFVLVALTPILWGLPIALMVAELSSTLPDEGGYYVWVKQTLGPFWGVQEGWWSICSIAFDMALYPVLFVDYLAYFFPSLALDGQGQAPLAVMLARWLIALSIVAISLIINWRGARSVGRSAASSAIWVIGPFVVLVLLVFARPGAPSAAWTAVINGLRGGQDLGLLTVGLSTVLWNYSGWDNVATFAAEVDNPQRNYPRAIGLTLPLITAVYLLPLLAGLAVTTDPAAWNESAGWPTIAHAAGGPVLGTLLAVAALVSAWSLFNSQLLSVSRVPYVMACDGWLPSALARVSPRTMIPTTALVVSSFVSAAFAVFTFQKLVVLDVLLYTAALALEFVALIVLRLRSPDIARPFRIPGGWPALAVVVAAPALCAAAIVGATVQDALSDPLLLLIVLAAVASGIVLYYARRRAAMSAV